MAPHALKKEFIKTLDRVCPSRRPYEVFKDWLEMAAIALHQAPYHNGDFAKDATFEKLEADYGRTESRFSQKERGELSKLLGLTLMAHRQGFGDFLGEIYQECEFGNERSGQFFTPYPLSKMMAIMALSGAGEIVASKGMIAISEPACGAGGMIVAAAEALAEQKIDPRAHAQFEAIDVDRTCFNMAYIQLSALDLQAVVKHGNALSLEIWESRKTPQLRYFNQWLEQRIEEDKPRAMLDAIRALIAEPPAADRHTPPPRTDYEQLKLDLTASDPPSKTVRKKAARTDVVLDRSALIEQLNLFDTTAFTEAAPTQQQRQPRPPPPRLEP